MKLQTALSATVALTPLFLVLSPLPCTAEEVLANPIVRYDARHDVSRPLREMALTAPKMRAGIEMPEPEHKWLLPEGPLGEDTAAQQFYLPTIHTVPVLSFDAIREDENNAQVPDTNGAVGSAQFVEITNFDYAVYDRTTGKNILSPTNTNTIFAGFGGRCQGTNPGDPVVVWDKLANRWLVSYFNYGGNDA